MTSWTTNNPAMTSCSLASLKPLVDAVKAAERKYAELDAKVFRFNGTLDEFKTYLKASGVGVGPFLKYEEGDHTPPKWMLGGSLEVWQVGGSFWVGTPKTLERLAMGDFVR